MKLIYTIFLILFLLPLSFAVSTVNVGSGNGGGGNNYYNVSNNNTYYNASAGFGLYANGSTMNVNSSVVQLSVNNTCSGSYAVQTILANGSLTCVGVGGGSGGSGNITGNGTVGQVPYWTNSNNLDAMPMYWNGSAIQILDTLNNTPDVIFYLNNSPSNKLDYVKSVSNAYSSVIISGLNPPDNGNDSISGIRAKSGGDVLIIGGLGSSILKQNVSNSYPGVGGGVTIQSNYGGKFINPVGDIKTGSTGRIFLNIPDVDFSNYDIAQLLVSNPNVTSVKGGTSGAMDIYMGHAGASYLQSGSTSGAVTISGAQGGWIFGPYNSSKSLTAGTGSGINIYTGGGGTGFNYTGGSAGNFAFQGGGGGPGATGGTAGQLIFILGPGGTGSMFSGGSSGIIEFRGNSGGRGNTSGGTGTPIKFTTGNGGIGNNTLGGSAGDMTFITGDGATGLTGSTSGGDIIMYTGTGAGGNVSGNIFLGSGGNKMFLPITRGNIAIGQFKLSTGFFTGYYPTSLVHLNLGTATAAYIKVTAGTTTGMTATDGFDVGISATGEAQLRQYENSNMTFWTNANSYMTLKNDGNLLINNLASAGNSFTCADSAGTLYDSATPCQPVTVTETDPIWTADKPNYASVVFVNSAVSALNATINAFNGAWTNSSTDVNTSLTPYINSNGANYGGYFLGNIDGNYEQSIANNNPGQYANANTCYYANISNKNTQYACIGVNGVNYSDPAYNSQSPLDSYWENSYGALHLDVANATQEISMFVGGVNQANIKINITNTTTKTYNPLTYPDGTTQYTAYAISQAHHNMRFIEFDSTTAGYTGIWVPTAIASGTAPVATAMGANHPGIVNVTANSGTAGSGYAFQQSNAGAFLLGPNYYTMTAFYIQCHTATTNITENRFGYQDIFTAAAVTDGVYWNISEINSTHYNATFSASNNTAISQGTSYNLPCNNWYMGEVYIDSPIGATGRIYRESGQVLTTQSITTNIPTSVGRETSSAVVSYLKGARYAQLGLTAYDYFEIGINATVIR